MFTEKEFEYFDYINEHRRNVMRAYNMMEKVVDSEYREYMGDLKNTVLNHDLSKFDEREFFPYRRHFFMTEEELKSGTLNDISDAFQHHYYANLHHPEAFLDMYDEKMPPICMLEMVLDWTAMSMKFGGTPLEYYRDVEQKEYEEKFSHIIDLERFVMLLSLISFELENSRKES